MALRARPSLRGVPPSALAPSYVSAAAVDVLGAENVGAASASAKRGSSKGKGGRGGGGGNGGGGGGSSGGGGGSGGGSGSGNGGGSGGFGGGTSGSGGGGSSGGSGSGGGRAGATQRGELLRSGVAIFDLDYDAILAAMYALSVSAEGDCYLCVPPDPGTKAAALGASKSALPGTAPAEALHTFTLDSGASRYLFHDRTTITPLSALVPIRLAGPSRGLVVARSSTLLPCRAVPSSSLSGLHLPSFSMNLVGTAALQDGMVTTTTPRVSCGTTALVTPPCHAFVACTLVSLSLVFPGLSLPYRPRLRHSAFLALRGGSAPLLLLLVSPDDCSPADSPHGLRLQLHERFHQDLPVLRLHFDRGVMEVARTSMIHAAAPHFLWPFAVRYAAHQLNIRPRVSLPETSPTLRWTGEVGDASVFRDVTFDELVPFYRLFPYRSAPPLPPPLFLAPDPPPVDPLPTQGPAPSGVPQVDPLPGTVPVEVAGNSGATRRAASEGAERGVVEPGGAESEGAGSGGAEPGGAERGGAELAGVERGGTESEGAESGGAEPRGTASSGGPTGALPCLSPRPEPLSPQQLREWFAQRTHLLSGASGAGDSAASDHGVGGAGVSAGVGGTGGTAAAGRGGGRTMGTRAAATGSVGGTGAGRVGAGDPAGPGGAGVGSTEAGGTGASGVGAGGAKAGGILAGGAGAGAGDTGAVDPRAGGAGAGGAVSGGTSAGGTLRSLPYFSRFLVSRLLLALLLPYCVHRPTSHSRRYRQPPHCLPLLLTICRLSIAASALVAKLLDFAATCRLDYATALVAESESANPPSVGGECALGTDVLESRAATGQRRAVVG
ncbi:unnamed protein product [Closterium sp. NIES-54]